MRELTEDEFWDCRQIIGRSGIGGYLDIPTVYDRNALEYWISTRDVEQKAFEVALDYQASGMGVGKHNILCEQGSTWTPRYLAACAFKAKDWANDWYHREAHTEVNTDQVENGWLGYAAEKVAKLQPDYWDKEVIILHPPKVRIYVPEPEETDRLKIFASWMIEHTPFFASLTYRQGLVLTYFFMGYRQAEIALILNVSKQRVWHILHVEVAKKWTSYQDSLT